MLAVTEGGGGIAGDPAAVDAAAATLRTAAKDFGDAADDIGSHGRAVTSEWTGTASDSAGDALARISTRTRIGDDICSAAATVLDQYASALRAAQSAYTAASTAATSAASAQVTAQNDMIAAQATSAQPSTDTSTQADARITATTTAATALMVANEAASSAADAKGDALAAAAAADSQAAAAIDALVTQLAAMTGAKISVPKTAAHTTTHSGEHSSQHGGGWLHDAWSWTEDHASTISSVAGTAAAITAFIPGVDLIATPLLIGVAVAAGTVATVHDVQEGENGKAVEDGAFTILNVVPGLALVKTLSKVDDAARLARSAEEISAKNAALERGQKMLGGKLPINIRYAGRQFPLSDDLAEKYPEGVSFTAEGFPDFSPHAMKIVKIDPLGPTREADFARANAEAGLQKTPRGYTCTMWRMEVCNWSRATCTAQSVTPAASQSAA